MCIFIVFLMMERLWCRWYNNDALPIYLHNIYKRIDLSCSTCCVYVFFKHWYMVRSEPPEQYRTTLKRKTFKVRLDAHVCGIKKKHLNFNKYSARYIDAVCYILHQLKFNIYFLIQTHTLTKLNILRSKLLLFFIRKFARKCSHILIIWYILRPLRRPHRDEIINMT